MRVCSSMVSCCTVQYSVFHCLYSIYASSSFIVHQLFNPSPILTPLSRLSFSPFPLSISAPVQIPSSPSQRPKQHSYSVSQSVRQAGTNPHRFPPRSSVQSTGSDSELNNNVARRDSACARGQSKSSRVESSRVAKSRDLGKGGNLHESVSGGEARWGGGLRAGSEGHVQSMRFMMV